MKKKLLKAKSIVDLKETVDSLEMDDLMFLTGGDGPGSGGSGTSSTSGDVCCDGTCTCVCNPPQPPGPVG